MSEAAAMARDFSGKNVVVTGAGGGLGRALALHFAAAGARGRIVAGPGLPGLGQPVATGLRRARRVV